MALESMHCSAYPLRTSQGCQQPFPTHQVEAVIGILKKKFSFKHQLDLETKHPEITICQERIFWIFWTGQKKNESKT